MSCFGENSRIAQCKRGARCPAAGVTTHPALSRLSSSVSAVSPFTMSCLNINCTPISSEKYPNLDSRFYGNSAYHPERNTELSCHWSLLQIQCFPLNLKKDLLSWEWGGMGSPRKSRKAVGQRHDVVDSGWSKSKISITGPFSSFRKFDMI